MADRSQQTEKATPRRLEKARREGRYVAARDFVAGVQFLIFVSIAAAWSLRMIGSLKEIMVVALRWAFRTGLTTRGIIALISWLLTRVLAGIALLGAVLIAGTLAAQFLVTRFGLSLSGLAPNFSRLSPLNRLRQMPRQNLPALGQALLILPVCGYAVYLIARERIDGLLLLPLQGVTAGTRMIGDSILTLLWRAAGLFVVFGLVNLVRQQRQYADDLKMSRQELKDEFKDTEGSPQIKARVRRLQLAMRRRHMMKDVPKATAVVVNPTHYAVAIRYEMETMPAPVVVAKGKNYIAARIRRIAIENQVPIIENPPLAQALYKAAEVGQEIPTHLYRAVAEVLAYVYKLMKGRT
ncbi:MAG TPA: EscU/YscU/HrcU family type III secretion system export apparatus switch protein [Bryobacteraceae bacterium]|jgi:flagellar biosynthetic protein FlhB